MNGDPQLPDRPPHLEIFRLVIGDDPEGERQRLKLVEMAHTHESQHRRFVLAIIGVSVMLLTAAMIGLFIIVRNGARPDNVGATAVPAVSKPLADVAASRPTADRAVLAAQTLNGLAIAGAQNGVERAEAAVIAVGAIDATQSVQPPFSGYLYDLPRDKAFASTWRRALFALPDRALVPNEWLVTLESSASANQALQTPTGAKYVAAWGCDPKACAARTLRLVYNLSDGAVAAAARLDGQWYALGSSARDDRAALLAVLARERLGLSTRFGLPDDAAAAIRRFIDAVRQ